MQTTPIDVLALTVTATSATVTIPNAPAVWPAGIYTASCVLSNPPTPTARVTNELPLILAPKLTQIPQTFSPDPPLVRNAQGVVTGGKP